MGCSKSPFTSSSSGVAKERGALTVASEARTTRRAKKVAILETFIPEELS